MEILQIQEQSILQCHFRLLKTEIVGNYVREKFRLSTEINQKEEKEKR